MAWKKEKSVAKANRAAVGGVAGGGGLAGVVAALLIAVRAAKPTLLPWEAEADGAIVAFVAAFGAYIGTFYRRYTDDKTKYTTGTGDGGTAAPVTGE